MEIWLCTTIGILLFVVIALSIKIYLLQKAAREIEEGFAERLVTETNTLLDISTRDKTMRRLANAVNTQLVSLRTARNRCQQGDMELKNAVTNISHDLRTPLTAICGYLDLLETEDKSENAARYLTIIRDRTEVLKQLTGELFRYSVVLTAERSGNQEQIVINTVLEESVAACYAELTAHHITPDISMPDNNVIRTLNRSDLSRIFSNLLNNAIKYSDGDLQITLSESADITFSNTASVLNEVQVGRLFDRFYTVETARKSTGLGLSITRTLVERMGGTVAASYENDRLSICIHFPQSI